MSIQPTTLLEYDPIALSWVAHKTKFLIDLPFDNIPLRIATWNIWEDQRHAHLRHPHIINTLLDIYPSIVLLQEATSPFFESLLQHPRIRHDFIVTDLEEQFTLCANFYSTLIFISKSLASRFDLSSAFFEFPNTRMARGLNIVNLETQGTTVLRVGTAHFESHMEDVRKRREQFKQSAYLLTSPELQYDEEAEGDLFSEDKLIPAILGGDCNIQSYTELDPLLSSPYSFKDAFLASRPSSQPPLQAHPTCHQTITNRRGPFRPSGPKRLDYILPRGELIHLVENDDTKSGFLGTEPVCEVNIATDDEGKDGLVWPSDHLGIWVDVVLSKVQ